MAVTLHQIIKPSTTKLAPRRLSSSGGFTLIEILIVLVIIAVMSSIVGLSVSSSGDRVFKNNLFKVSALLEGIADESVYTNGIISCDFSDTITCKSYKNGEWNDFNLNKAATWKWPREIKVISISVNGVALKPGENMRFSPSGDIQSVSFQLTDGIHKGWIDSDNGGEFKVHY